MKWFKKRNTLEVYAGGKRDTYNVAGDGMVQYFDNWGDLKHFLTRYPVKTMNARLKRGMGIPRTKFKVLKKMFGAYGINGGPI